MADCWDKFAADLVDHCITEFGPDKGPEMALAAVSCLEIADPGRCPCGTDPDGCGPQDEAERVADVFREAALDVERFEIA
jgi:hypothetical protein